MPHAAQPRSNRPGFFLVVEGSDGSGKSTLARRLRAALEREGFTVCAVREPGGTRLSERVRQVLLHSRENISPRAELYLYLASRAQLIDEVIRPALQRGEVVVADRFSLSTYAYQSGGRGLPLGPVIAADQFARDGIQPDLTLVLAVSEADAEARLESMGNVPDRIERESRPFHRRVRRFYQSWAKKRPRHHIIDSARGADAVLEEAMQLVRRKLRRSKHNT
ncbi:MAG TPA: dTMP kinase [bacterium]|nr:dTMP kinase [bacterium]